MALGRCQGLDLGLAGTPVHRLPALRSPPPSPSPRPLALAPRAARSRRPRGAAPRRLLSFQPRWRRAARVRAQSRSMTGSYRRSKAPTPPAWGPPSGKALIPPGPRIVPAGRSSGAGRGGPTGGARGGGRGRSGAEVWDPGRAEAEQNGLLHLSAPPASAVGAVSSQPVGVATAVPLTPGAAAPPRDCRPASGLPDRGGTEGALAAGVRGAKVNC